MSAMDDATNLAPERSLATKRADPLQAVADVLKSYASWRMKQDPARDQLESGVPPIGGVIANPLSHWFQELVRINPKIATALHKIPENVFFGSNTGLSGAGRTNLYREVNPAKIDILVNPRYGEAEIHPTLLHEALHALYASKYIKENPKAPPGTVRLEPPLLYADRYLEKMGDDPVVNMYKNIEAKVPKLRAPHAFIEFMSQQILKRQKKSP